jgi:osmotically-inducible protein OsmY
MARRLPTSPLALCALVLAGCSGRDADQLGRVARSVAVRFDSLTGGAQEKLANGLQAARASWTEITPDVRVAERLRWDKELASSDIAIDCPSPGLVRLQGPITSAPLRRRAVDLAQNTLGVDKVVDDLTGPQE